MMQLPMFPQRSTRPRPFGSRAPSLITRRARAAWFTATLALGAGLLFATTEAKAATVALSPAYTTTATPSLPRVVGDENTPVKKRSQNLNPEGVNLQDCIDDQKIQFPLALSDYATTGTTGHIEVWASTASTCQATTDRSGNSQTCWRLTSNVPLQPYPLVTIPVRTIMAGVNNRATNPDSSENVCGTVDLSTVTVYFLWFDPAQTATPSSNLAVPVQVDTVGPPAPTGLKNTPGNGRIFVSWNAFGEGGAVSILGVKAYCDRNTTTGTPQTTCEDTGTPVETKDAAAETDDADASDLDATATTTPDPNCEGTATGASSSCGSPNLAPASGDQVLPDNAFNAKYECGSISGSTASSVTASTVGGAPLQNGMSYAVAVAATDNFNNVGPLSAVVCETPEETNDFWENYKEAGGGAGGGYCSTEGAGLPVGSTSVLAFLGFTAVTTLQRRRRRRSSPRG